MKAKDILKLVLLYAVLFVVGSAAYVACFHTPFLAFLDVFFYRGIALIVFWGIVCAVVMGLLKRNKSWKKVITVRDIILMFMMYCCVNVVIFTHLPVTADRSITVFMLGYMTDRETQTFSEEDIQHVFEEVYVEDYKAFSKRFHEQEETGTIEPVADGQYQITGSGKKLMKIYEIVGKLYNLDDNLIHPDDAE